MKNQLKCLLVLLPVIFLLGGCGSKIRPADSPKDAVGLEPQFGLDHLVVAPNLEYDILFSSADSVLRGDGKRFESKKKFDFLHFFQGDSPENGLLWVNHEDSEANPNLGDGGGGSVLELKRTNQKWKSTEKYHVDFEGLGGTIRNCLGAATPWGTILTSEEMEFPSNASLERYGITDSSDYKGFPRYLNYGWMVEVDIRTKKAIKKHFGMGRFMHEGAYCMPDSKTVYLLDDEDPGVFFKFVSDEKGNYDNGILYAFKQNAEGQPGEWLALPRDRESMNHARMVALKAGATIYDRMEDIEPDGKGGFFISETGEDSSNFAQAIGWGGKVARHLNTFSQDGKIFRDYHGRILHYDPKNEQISVFLEGGPDNTGKTVLSNPDNISFDKRRNRLIIHEDIYNMGHNRSGGIGTSPTNEVYYLDLTKKPMIENLTRIAIIPKGAESTGPAWNDDFSTLFFNIQSPSSTNPSPFNENLTVALRGFSNQK